MNREVLKNVMRLTLPALLILTVGLYFAWDRFLADLIVTGKTINQKAWESSYTERELRVPDMGPREGYWGARIGKKVPDTQLGWREPQLHIPGLIEIDELGHQHYRIGADNNHRILILGGSVAFGANASEISKTYFNVLGNILHKNSIDSKITIIATGAWKSIQEVRATELFIKKYAPNLIVFLDGLNDLTNGSTSKTLFGEKTQPLNGEDWTVFYHTHDYERRVSDYLNNIALAADISRINGNEMLVVLQPALYEKRKMSDIENLLLRRSLVHHSSIKELLNSYSAIRAGLTRLESDGRIHFLDASRIFDSEERTIYVDMWHFTDIGHEILGWAMADKIKSIYEGLSFMKTYGRNITIKPHKD